MGDGSWMVRLDSLSKSLNVKEEFKALNLVCYCLFLLSEISVFHVVDRDGKKIRDMEVIENIKRVSQIATPICH